MRAAALDAPILLLSQPRPDEVDDAVALGLHVTLYSPGMVERLGSAAAAAGVSVPVHLKVDTGMHRVGAQPDEVPALAKAIVDHPALELAAVWTHCAVADEPEDPFTGVQLERYEAVLADLAAVGIEVPLRHAGQLGRRHRPPGRPLRPRSLRHRGVRHPARPGARRCRRARTRRCASPRRCRS